MMSLNRKKHNILEYLPIDKEESIWGMSVIGTGFQSIAPGDPYPLKGHPIGYTFNPDYGRVLDCYAIVYITKGKGVLSSVAHSQKKIEKGDLFFLLPGQWHSYCPMKQVGWDEYWVTFQGEYVKNIIDQIVVPEDPIYSIGIYDKLIFRFNELQESARRQQPGFQAVLSGILLYMLGLIYSINKCHDIGSVPMQKIQEACVLMQENIFNKFTPEDVAKSINMSYSSFRKSFKQYIGIAPHQYLLKLKLNKSKDLLSNTNMSIQDIATKMNFESSDYFSYFFKGKTGVNPLSYRKEVERQREKAKQDSLGKDHLTMFMNPSG